MTIFQTDDDHVAPLRHDLLQAPLIVAAGGGVELIGLLRKLDGSGDVRVVERLQKEPHAQPGVKLVEAAGRRPFFLGFSQGLVAANAPRIFGGQAGCLQPGTVG